MIVVGVGNAIDLNAWRILFYGSIDEHERGQTVGIYQTIMSITTALILALGGFIGEKYGYNIVLIIGGLMSFTGGILPLFLRKIVTKK